VAAQHCFLSNGISPNCRKLDLGFGNLFLQFFGGWHFFSFLIQQFRLLFTRFHTKFGDIGIQSNWGNHFSDFTWRVDFNSVLMAEEIFGQGMFSLDRITFGLNLFRL